MGRFASFGALGWVIGSLSAGLIALYFAVKGVFILCSLFCLVGFLIALVLTERKHKPLHIPLFPVSIIKKNMSVYASLLIRHSGAHIIWTFWPLYLMSLGADVFWVSVIQAINSSTQFLFMFFVTDKINSKKLVRIGILLSGITFFMFALVPNFWYILPVQILLGISWAFLYVGSLRYLTDRNVEKATVSGMLDSVLSLSSIIGPFLATIIVSFADYRTTMYVASVLTFFGFFVFQVLGRSDKIFKSRPLRL